MGTDEDDLDDVIASFLQNPEDTNGEPENEVSGKSYATASTSKNSAIVVDVVLSEKELTRRIARPLIVNNVNDSAANVKISLIHQRRANAKAKWEDEPAFNLARLTGGQEIRLELSCAEVLKLFEALGDLYMIGTQGVPQGERTLVVSDAAETMVISGRERKIIRSLAEQSPDFWPILEEIESEPLEALLGARLHKKREAALQLFEEHMASLDWSETSWQAFFEENTWIFGHGLLYQFASQLEEQPLYGGKDVSGAGGQQGDYLFGTEAAKRFAVLVDIKKPDTRLLGNAPYRNRVWRLGPELTGGVSQLQSNCRTWETEGSRQEHTAEALSSANVFTYGPRGILVIGNTTELDDRDKVATFELFRRNTVNPEILTYDELLARTRFLVNESAENVESR